jgi:hypothetical protein
MLALAASTMSCSSGDEGRGDDAELQALLRDGKLPTAAIFEVRSTTTGGGFGGGGGGPIGGAAGAGGMSAGTDAGAAGGVNVVDAGNGGSFGGGVTGPGGGFGTGGDFGTGGFGTGGGFGTAGDLGGGGVFGAGGSSGKGGGFVGDGGPIFELRPTGRWDFESCNPSRTEIFDSSPNGHTAFRSVSVDCAEGVEGQGLAFDAEQDIAYVPDQPDFTFDRGVTVAAWVNPDRVDGTRTILRKRLTETSSFVLLVNGGKFQVVALLKSGRAISVSSKATANAWTHVAATYDNYTLKLYLNGKQAAMLNANGVINTGQGPLLMGNDIFERRLSGRLDTVVFDTQPMSDSEIAALTCLHHPATVSATPMSSPPLTAGTPFAYDLALTSHDTETCPPQPYFLSTTFIAGFSIFGNPSFVTVPAGGTSHVSLSVQSGSDAEPETVHVPFTFFPEFVPGSTSMPAQGEVQYVIAEPPGCHVSNSRELVIRDLSVVDDPMRTTFNGSASDPRTGAWTFGKLMENLSPTPADAPQIVEEMLKSWLTDQTVNGFTVGARPAMNDLVLSQFPRTPDGSLDLHRAPLQLLAIVNRFDLNLSEGNAGEGRFVFGVLGPGGFPLQFTFIVEYLLPANTEADVQRWAEDWHALSSHPFPSEEYNAALQALTQRFAGRNVSPTRQNGSALLQIRSNEIALSFEWQLRQFQLAPSGHLVNTPLPLTPDRSFNFSPTLVDFINANQSDIIAEKHVVPVSFEGQPFQAGAVVNDLSPWFAPGTDNEARFHFSANTCNGCHSSETNTTFLQIAPRFSGTPAQLSPFLTGTIVFDPVTGEPRALNEQNRRNRIMHVRVCPNDPPPPPPTVPPPPSFDGGFGGSFPVSEGGAVEVDSGFAGAGGATGAAGFFK